MDDLIFRHDALSALLKQELPSKSVIRRVLRQLKSVDAVPRTVVEQIQWERDCAIGQLEEHGIPFGGIAPDVVEVVRCKDCYRRYDINECPMCALIEGEFYDYTMHDGYCDRGDKKLSEGEE